MIELGGNICLKGFDDVEKGKLIIIKKILGNYVKNLIERIKNFESILISVKTEENNFVEVKLKYDENEIIANSNDKNLFFAMNNALENLEESIK
jgi:ribosome-associated translation inhibitor RaiA